MSPASYQRAASQAGAPLEVGSLVGDKYVVIDLLGRGGMANVWLARDERLGKLWAVKEIKAAAAGPDARRRRQALIDEANFMKRLDHPAIPRIVDILDVGGAVYVVMDYVEGQSLSSSLRQRGGAPFDQGSVLSWGVQLCDVLAYLHGLEPAVVYRDLKPANVIVRDDGSVRLIDFGIATELTDALPHEVAGTPGYGAPEQLAQGHTACVDARSDLYSLGATLYTLASGHTPRMVAGPGPARKVDFDMRPLRVWDASLSEGLERIVLRACEADPDARYQTAQEMRYDLEHYEELTDAWREERQKKVARFTRLRGSALACAALGLACVGLSWLLRATTYADLMREAQSAPALSQDGGASLAERLYTAAAATDPSRVEPYQRLIAVYEADYLFDEDEVRRWQGVYAKARNLDADPAYPQLCLDVATCYLCYYGIDKDGGSVGNAALVSLDAAVPWLERVLALTEADAAEHAPIDEADKHMAATYLTIARFHDSVARAGREGTAHAEVYRQFLDSLSAALEHELRAAPSQRNTEGVRARLCQVSVEALCSPTYVAGFLRAGIGLDEMGEVLGMTRELRGDLVAFAEADEYAVVFGPVFEEVDSGLELADATLMAAYENPVHRWEES